PPPCLPPARDQRPTLVLDLDETLVHSQLRPSPLSTHQQIINYENRTLVVHVHVRPFARKFLQHVAELFEVIVFTASQEIYAGDLLDWLDPEGHIQHRLYRQHCQCLDNTYVKDLRCLGRPLERTIIVDNNPLAFALQVENGLPVSSWYDDPEDSELLGVLRVLRRLA
ncbi:uncharacterized protein MONBRDRAFT_2855, partial [Monosiga brevicollis MX1]